MTMMLNKIIKINFVIAMLFYSGMAFSVCNGGFDNAQWRAFVSSTGGYQEPDENLADVINNGIARIPPSLSGRSYYWTNFRLADPTN